MNEACTFVDLLGELIEDTLLPCGGKLRAWQERWKRIRQVLAVTYRPRLKSMWCDGGESRGRHVIICPFNKVHPSPALRLGCQTLACVGEKPWTLVNSSLSGPFSSWSLLQGLMVLKGHCGVTNKIVAEEDWTGRLEREANRSDCLSRRLGV